MSDHDEPDQIPATVFLDELERMRRRMGELDKERERIRIQLDFLEHMLDRAGVEDGSGVKLGPTEAVKRIVGMHPGMPRSQVIEEAIPIVKTAASKARRTLAQTILNLLGRGTLREESGGLFLVTTKAALADIFAPPESATPGKPSGQPG